MQILSELSSFTAGKKSYSFQILTNYKLFVPGILNTGPLPVSGDIPWSVQPINHATPPQMLQYALS